MDQPRIQPQADNGHQADPADRPEEPTQAMRQAIAQLMEAREYALYFLAAKLDAWKLSIRKAVVWTAVGAVALLLCAAMLVTAAVIAVLGLAQAVGVLLGSQDGPRIWAGYLIVGSLLIAVVALAAWLGVRRIFERSRKRTVDRYERWIQRQRVDFGHDVRQRSAEQHTANF
ncbi:phage holin family protein [Fontivita pretiosa]|jgi:hypothetical protein|uniref:phage holin family protein n=1 Tax=Fontivita pretiosa TaxID=2989684 RepID=UPI003D167265